MEDEREKYSCPCCGMDITETVRRWMDGELKLRGRLEAAKPLLEEIVARHRALLERVSGIQETPEQEAERERREDEAILTRIHEERKRLKELKAEARRKLDAVPLSELLGENRRKPYKKAPEGAHDKAIALAHKVKRDKRNELLADESRHAEYLHMEDAHNEACRRRIATKNYEELLREAALRGVSRLMVYRTHGNRIYMQYTDAKSFMDCLASYKAIRRKKLYLRKYEQENGDYVYGLFHVTADGCALANMVWSIGLDLTGMFPGTDEIAPELEAKSLERVRERARRMAELCEEEQQDEEDKLEDARSIMDL